MNPLSNELLLDVETLKGLACGKKITREKIKEISTRMLAASMVLNEKSSFWSCMEMTMRTVTELLDLAIAEITTSRSTIKTLQSQLADAQANTAPAAEVQQLNDLFPETTPVVPAQG